MRTYKPGLNPIAAAIALSGAVAVPASAWAQATTPQTVEVIGTSPLPGQGIDRALLPYGTQLLRRQHIDAAQADTASDLLQRRLPGVQVNEIQGSPFQGDLTFRGFRASGLIGAAQGLSVYLDGVRVNEPFGDVVNWDLLPEFALDSIALVPGANPAFGLNTLGGAITLTTSTGRSAPGLRAQVTFGSFGRKRIELSHGDAGGDWQHFVGIGLFDEEGWRDHSPGRSGSVLAKLGRQTAAGELQLSLLAGRSRLVGNGLVPSSTFDDDGLRTHDLGAARREAVYTHPDLTRNRLSQLGLSWRHALDERTAVEALAYVRNSRRSTVNGDEAEEGDDDEASAVNAAFNRTTTQQRGSGLALALSGRRGGHQWQAGTSLDRAGVSYEQTEQEGRFTDDRGVEPQADEDPELSIDVRGRSTLLGLYVTDTWRLAPTTHLTATLRFNQARIANTLTSVDDDTDELVARPRESFRYRSWNPALGLAQRLDGSSVTLFANVARNARVPTVIELGCADPDEPCRLPAGLQADPYLAQVRSTSVEGGARWGAGLGAGGSLTVFRTDNRDDILFRSVSVTGQRGYFQNFERTRHQGLEAEWRWQARQWALSMSYSHLDATYQADGNLRMGERNVEIRRGTRIAGLPRQMAKFVFDARVTEGLSFGADLQAISRRGVAGNEDGRFDNDEDEVTDFSLPGYAVVNLRATWRPVGWQGLELTARVGNLFDRRYASFGALAETRFDAQGAYSGEERDALFTAPGAPRAVFVGVRLRF